MSAFFHNNPIADDPAAQVKLIVDAARAEGAQRVVLVGASLGGSVTVTAAGQAKPDANAVLSSSAKEGPSDITTDAPHVTMPALFVFSRADQDDLVVVRSQLKKMPAKKKEFLVYDSGHGYTLLHDLMTGEFTGLATRVAKWAVGLPVVAEIEQRYLNPLLGKKIGVEEEAAKAIAIPLMQQDRDRLPRSEPCAVERRPAWCWKLPLGDPRRNGAGTELLDWRGRRERGHLGRCARGRG